MGRKKKSPQIIKCGTIDGLSLLMNREGKVNVQTHPEIRGAVHKSPKDYDRNKSKSQLKKARWDND